MNTMYISSSLASKFCWTLSWSQDGTTQIHKEIFYSNFITMLLFFKCRTSVDCVISVIVKTVFVLMLLFDIGKVCRTKVFTKT